MARVYMDLENLLYRLDAMISTLIDASPSPSTASQTRPKNRRHYIKKAESYFDIALSRCYSVLKSRAHPRTLCDSHRLMMDRYFGIHLYEVIGVYNERSISRVNLQAIRI